MSSNFPSLKSTLFRRRLVDVLSTSETDVVSTSILGRQIARRLTKKCRRRNDVALQRFCCQLITYSSVCVWVGVVKLESWLLLIACRKNKTTEIRKIQETFERICNQILIFQVSFFLATVSQVLAWKRTRGVSHLSSECYLIMRCFLKISALCHGLPYSFQVNLISEHIWCSDYLVRSFYLKNMQVRLARLVLIVWCLMWTDKIFTPSLIIKLHFNSHLFLHAVDKNP